MYHGQYFHKTGDICEKCFCYHISWLLQSGLFLAKENKQKTNEVPFKLVNGHVKKKKNPLGVFFFLA